MNTKAPPLDIFQVLNNISKKNKNFYLSLTEDQMKAFQPYVIMRWLSGTTDARQIYFLNELVNPFVFLLGNYKQLLNFLLITSTSGKQQRYTWSKTLTKKTSRIPTSVDVIKNYFKYSTIEAIEIIPLLSNEDILKCAEEMGYQTEEITKLKKELKHRNGNS